MIQQGEKQLPKVTLYVSCLGEADSMLIGYRSLFLVIETLLVSLGIGLLAVEKSGYLWVPASLGFLICFASFFVFRYGRKRVDYWRDRIFEELEGTDLREVFWKIYRPVYIWKIPSPLSPRFWFDVVAPSVLVVIWIFVLFIR